MRVVRRLIRSVIYFFIGTFYSTDNNNNCGIIIIIITIARVYTRTRSGRVTGTAAPVNYREHPANNAATARIFYITILYVYCITCLDT